MSSEAATKPTKTSKNLGGQLGRATVLEGNQKENNQFGVGPILRDTHFTMFMATQHLLTWADSSEQVTYYDYNSNKFKVKELGK